MRFTKPDITYLFFLPVMLVFLYAWLSGRRKKSLERFAQREVLAELAGSLDLRKRNIKAFLVTVALVFLILALMRPEWGFRWEEVKRKGLDIIIALDTSKSMLAEDIKPNRLERSKLAIKDLVKKLKGDRIGLVAFAGTAFLQCPLTVDYNGFMLALNSVQAGIIPRDGTSISSAIYEAMESFEGGEKQYGVLIIITDGEDHEGNAVKAAQDAARAGIKIFCIGIGTKEGELIPVQNPSGKIGFLKDARGNVVKTRLNEDALKSVALATGGSYVRATAMGFGLDFIYEQKLSKLEKREIEAKMKKHYRQKFQIPLAVAFLLLFAEPFINDRKRKK